MEEKGNTCQERIMLYKEKKKHSVGSFKECKLLVTIEELDQVQ